MITGRPADDDVAGLSGDLIAGGGSRRDAV